MKAKEVIFKRGLHRLTSGDLPVYRRKPKSHQVLLVCRSDISGLTYFQSAHYSSARL